MSPEEYMAAFIGYQAGRAHYVDDELIDKLVEALRRQTEYVQKEASLHHLSWAELKDNQVLIAAMEALALADKWRRG